MTGKTLGHYQVLEKLGEGGMGVVYKARDMHLDRSVAIKVLPPEAVANPERKRRFVQEAKAASALNHPNILHIYDIDTADGVDFIAMEYVEGKTLDELIGRKGLELSEALKYGVQIADALAAAHAVGIVHRDIKPSNIMVSGPASGRPGVVKVLDFGLAKLTEQAEDDGAAPTQTMRPRTEEGTIVGTVAYMSPEQAQGKKVDARSDIFSFGSVLYEMLTGRRPFQGENKISTLSAILHKEPPPVSEIVEATPSELDKIIARCLRKDAERRIQHMDDVKLALEDLKEESDSGRLAPATTAGPKPRRRLVPAAVALAILAAVAIAIWYLRPTIRSTEGPLSAVPLTSYPGFEQQPSFSPDGNQVAFTWNGEKQDNFDIYVKLIGPGSPLRLTTDPAVDFSPAWSPDGRTIAFLRGLTAGRSAVLLIPALGGPERKVSEAYVFFVPSEIGRLASSPFLTWSPDGKWLVVQDKASPEEPPALFLLSVETGEKRRLTSSPTTTMPGGGGDGGPAFSPDGRTLAFCRFTGGFGGDLYLLALSAELAAKGEPKRLTFDNRYTRSPAWTPDGREIIFSSGRVGSFGLWRIELSGSRGPQRLSVGEDGVYPAISRQVSPRGGSRFVYTRWYTDTNIWRLDLPGPGEGTARPTLFISSTRNEMDPRFSPDGKSIAFVSDRSGNNEIWICQSNGSNCAQLTSSGGAYAGSPRWSPDGENIAFDCDAGGQWNVYVVGRSGGKPRRVTTDAAGGIRPNWSRDGKWIYFAAKSQIWKIPARGGQPVQVTGNGGNDPVESPDGKYLYYLKTIGTIHSTLWRLPTTGGGEESQVLDSVAGRYFAVFQQGIYFVSPPNPDGASPIRFHDFSGTTKTLGAIDKPACCTFSVSPEGRTILYHQIDRQGSELMLVENFR